DGERSFRNARLSTSFAPGTTAGTVLRAIATATGLALGNVSAAVAKLDSLTLQQGYVVSGSVARALDRLLYSLGYGYSVQRGALQILADGDVLDDSIPLISPTTGLIGSPEMGSPEASGKPALCRFQSLLVATAPGKIVHLTSDRYDTDLVVKKCEFSGDTHGGDWTTTIYGEIRR
ncbi:MAG TPA: hypothetical protein VMV41_11660, partial [Cellulomonadaceae bacterium]|nr:hypothetical protein [Cellulomonadaceae bacterium]